MTEARRRTVAGAAPMTEQARLFQGRRAGLVTRGAANAIDVVVTLVLLGSAYAAAAAASFLWNPRQFSFPRPSFALTLVVGSVLAGLYFALSWVTTGRTYGDFVMGLRVVQRDGRHPGWVVSVLRAATCVVFPIGLLWVGVDRRRRAVQDLLFGTAVIYDWPGQAR